MPSLKSRLRSGIAGIPGAGAVLSPALRVRAIALIARSGLFDLDWYRLQTGRDLDSVPAAAREYAAVRDYVDRGRRAGLSPHPLFEPAFIEPETWATRSTDPLAHYLLSPARRLHRDPHPLFDVSEYVRAHPESPRHPSGPLAHFLASAVDSSPLPVPVGLLRHRATAPTWGEVRASAVDAVTTWRAQQQLRAPRQVRHHDAPAERAFRAEVAPARAALRIESAVVESGVVESGGVERPDGAPLVSIVLPTWNRGAQLRRAVESVQAQTLRRWELLVVDDGSTDDTAAVLEGLRAFDPRIRAIAVPHGGVSAARNAGIGAARAGLLAFLDSDNTWEPEFLELMVAGMRTRSLDFAYSAMRLDRAGATTWREFEGGREALRAGNHIDLNVLLAATRLVREVGGFDTSLRRTVDYDLVLSLADHAEPGYLPFVGAVYTDTDDDPTRISRSEPLSWDTVVRARHALDWSTATPADALVAGRVSVLLGVGADFQPGAAVLGRLTADVTQAVAAGGDDVAEPLDPEVDPADDRDGSGSGPDAESQDLASEAPPDLPGTGAAPVLRDVEILVLDRAGTRAGAAVLAAQALLDPRIRIRRVPADTGVPFGLDTLLIDATGEFSVLVEPSMTLEPGWLPELVGALVPGVLATSALLLERDGSVGSAGAVFDRCVDLPVPLLRGHPGSEALTAGALDVAALDGSAPLSPAIAARTADLVAVHGLDPLFAAVLYDVDLGLRLAEDRPGVFRTVATATAIRTGEAPDEQRAAPADQKIFIDRWAGRLPGGAREAWARFGCSLAHVATATNEVGATVLTPVVVRPPRLVHPGDTPPVPSLRWAIMTAAPVGRRRRDWGDWYFAEALATALRALGQDAVINPRTAQERPLGHLDDVVLTLRGLSAFPLDPGTTNLLWVISHPELVTPAEVAAYDATFAASLSWSKEMTRRTGRTVEPLLQCTDPGRFSPEAAGSRVVAGEKVLFVGNSRKVRRPVIDAAIAAGAELAVYGGGWGELIPERMIRGRHVPNEELATHYRSAGVVLNDHWDDMRTEGFISNRLFDVVASGGRAISDPVAGIGEIFGDSVRTFDRRSDLAHLLTADPDTVFGPESQRLATARRIAADHSFDARAARLLAVALDHRRR